jgi:hypothetical protein
MMFIIHFPYATIFLLYQTKRLTPENKNPPSSLKRCVTQCNDFVGFSLLSLIISKAVRLNRHKMRASVSYAISARNLFFVSINIQRVMRKMYTTYVVLHWVCSLLLFEFIQNWVFQQNIIKSCNYHISCKSIERFSRFYMLKDRQRQERPMRDFLNFSLRTRQKRLFI